jgi:hypothetical protein
MSQVRVKRNLTTAIFSIAGPSVHREDSKGKSGNQLIVVLVRLAGLTRLSCKLSGLVESGGTSPPGEKQYGYISASWGKSQESKRGS